MKFSATLLSLSLCLGATAPAFADIGANGVANTEMTTQARVMALIEEKETAIKERQALLAEQQKALEDMRADYQARLSARNRGSYLMIPAALISWFGPHLISKHFNVTKRKAALASAAVAVPMVVYYVVSSIKHSRIQSVVDKVKSEMSALEKKLANDLQDLELLKSTI